MIDNYITNYDEKGTINISVDVIGNIVRSVVLDIDGVSSLSNSFGNEIAGFIGLKNINKGVRIQFNDNETVIDLIITVCYGSNIVSVCEKVQECVLSEVENLIGLENVEVNVHVTGIAFQND